MFVTGPHRASSANPHQPALRFNHASGVARRRQVRPLQENGPAARAETQSQRAIKSVRQRSVRSGPNRQTADARPETPCRLGRGPESRFFLDRATAMRPHQYTVPAQNLHVRVPGAAQKVNALEQSPPSAAGGRRHPAANRSLVRQDILKAVQHLCGVVGVVVV